MAVPYRPNDVVTAETPDSGAFQVRIVEHLGTDQYLADVPMTSGRVERIQFSGRWFKTGPFRDSTLEGNFRYIVDDMLGELPPAAVEAFTKSGDFALYQKAATGTDLTPAEFDRYVRVADAQLGALPAAAKRRLAASPEFHIYSDVARRHIGR